MGILVYRDRGGSRDLAGRIDYATAGVGSFAYDPDYLKRAQSAGELGISNLLPLDSEAYSAEEFGPFFRGLLPEGEVYGNLAELYQISRSDYLTMLEQTGCECIGALTFVSEKANLAEYEPRYEPVSSETIASMINDPVRMATLTASSTRLSLAGAQSKVAWFLAREASANQSFCDEWFIPRGTAPSTHIIKISRKGEEETAINELACSLLSAACGIETAKVSELPDVPGSISVERYDRIRMLANGSEVVVRLHQEDFCQALGLAPFLKYQPQGVAANYPAMAADLIESTSGNPQSDKLEFAKRLVFCYVVGNSDAHLKNFSLLYNAEWTQRRLSPLYDVTCIPLTGYSTAMPFDIGEHRDLDAIDERDIMMLAADLDVGLSAFDRFAKDLIATLEAPPLESLDQSAERMVDRILENSSIRIRVLKRFLGCV